MLLIMDNAAYHHSANLDAFLDRHRDRLELLILPPYSPELNPIERVWKLLRRLKIHNQYFEKLDNLMRAISEQLKVWYIPNQELTRLCCIN